MYNSKQEVAKQYVEKLRHHVANTCKWLQQRAAQLLTKTALQWHNDNDDKDR